MAKGTSGSPRHTESFGPGPKAGAGEVGGQFLAPSSGKAGMRVKMDQANNPTRKTPSGSGGPKAKDDGE